MYMVENGVAISLPPTSSWLPSQADILPLVLEILRDVQAKVTSIQVQLDHLENRQESFREGVKHLAARIDNGAVASAPNTPATSSTINEPRAPSADSQPEPAPLVRVSRVQETPTSSRTINPWFVPGKEPDEYLLGGNENMVRSVSEYKVILKEVNQRKQEASNADQGRLLCLNLMRREIPKEELARKNVTGNSRDKNNKKYKIGTLDREIVHSISQQAKMQFPDFHDWYTDHKCKTVEAINERCKPIPQEFKENFAIKEVDL